MNDLEFEAALLSAVSDDFIQGFRAGWEATGDGYNAEYPDSGKSWTESEGYLAMLREIRSRVMPGARHD